MINNDSLSNIALLSIAKTRAESISLEDFADEFDSRHNSLSYFEQLIPVLCFWSRASNLNSLNSVIFAELKKK